MLPAATPLSLPTPLAFSTYVKFGSLLKSGRKGLVRVLEANASRMATGGPLGWAEAEALSVITPAPNAVSRAVWMSAISVARLSNSWKLMGVDPACTPKEPSTVVPLPPPLWNTAAEEALTVDTRPLSVEALAVARNARPGFWVVAWLMASAMSLAI